MADKILMNKNTLAALKNELKEYEAALPVFEMKEQQLKEAVQNVETSIQRLQKAIEATNQQVQSWSSVMAEQTIDLSTLANVQAVNTDQRELTGVTIEVFRELTFEDAEVDLFDTPLWIDTAMDVLRDQKNNRTLIDIERKNLALLQEELAEARRMKNALKEVFIPETKDNIRKIIIYLGDVERLAIGCAKLVKKKKQEKSLL